jgi:hypothetical protein
MFIALFLVLSAAGVGSLLQPQSTAQVLFPTPTPTSPAEVPDPTPAETPDRVSPPEPATPPDVDEEEAPPTPLDEDFARDLMRNFARFETYRVESVVTWDLDEGPSGTANVMTEVVNRPAAQRWTIDFEQDELADQSLQILYVGRRTYMQLDGEWREIPPSLTMMQGRVRWVTDPAELINFEAGRFIGWEMVDGIQTERYRYGFAAFEPATRRLQLESAHADVWISRELGVYVQSNIRMVGEDAMGNAGVFTLQSRLVEINQPIDIQAPDVAPALPAPQTTPTPEDNDVNMTPTPLVPATPANDNDRMPTPLVPATPENDNDMMPTPLVPATPENDNDVMPTPLVPATPEPEEIETPTPTTEITPTPTATQTPPPTPTPTVTMTPPPAPVAEETGLILGEAMNLDVFATYRMQSIIRWAPETEQPINALIDAEVVHRPPAERATIDVRLGFMGMFRQRIEYVNIEGEPYIRQNGRWISAATLDLGGVLQRLGWIGDPAMFVDEDAAQFVGVETVDGIQTRHYRYDTQAIGPIGFLTEVDEGQVDVWMWVSTQQNVRAPIRISVQAEGTTATGERGRFELETRIYDVNTPIQIERPEGLPQNGVPDAPDMTPTPTNAVPATPTPTTPNNTPTPTNDAPAGPTPTIPNNTPTPVTRNRR